MQLTLTQAMNTLKPLFTESLLSSPPDWPDHATPVVRYSDHCAALAEKERLRANAVHRCDQLLKQLERMALLCEDQAARLNRMEALKTYHENKPLDEFIGRVAGRWDGKPKVL